jgi:hypothetical protein
MLARPAQPLTRRVAPCLGAAELAGAAGAVQLSHVTLPGSLRLLSTLSFFPPQRGGLTGAGAVLACSSLHWLADAGHLGGGLWQPGSFDRYVLPHRLAGSTSRDCPNAPLLLNFVASAVARRGLPVQCPVCLPSE